MKAPITFAGNRNNTRACCLCIVVASPTSSRVQTTHTPKVCILPAPTSSTKPANSTTSSATSLERKLQILALTIVHKSIENPLTISISDKIKRAGQVQKRSSQRYLTDLNKIAVVAAITITVHRVTHGLRHRKLSLMNDQEICIKELGRHGSNSADRLDRGPAWMKFCTLRDSRSISRRGDRSLMITKVVKRNLGRRAKAL